MMKEGQGSRLGVTELAEEGLSRIAGSIAIDVARRIVVEFDVARRRRSRRVGRFRRRREGAHRELSAKGVTCGD